MKKTNIKHNDNFREYLVLCVKLPNAGHKY